MFFEAAARVHRETDILLLTHTQEGTMGPEQAEMLIDLGVAPSKIVIGHMCGNTDLAYHKRTLRTGVKIGFDRFGIQQLIGAPMDEERINTLNGLVKQGFENQIMLSHDSINHWLGRPPVMNEEMAILVKNWHPTHLFENIIPELKAKGMEDKKIEAMFYL